MSAECESRRLLHAEGALLGGLSIPPEMARGAKQPIRVLEQILGRKGSLLISTYDFLQHYILLNVERKVHIACTSTLRDV